VNSMSLKARFKLICLLKYIFNYFYLSDIAYQPEHIPEINEEDAPRRK